MNNMTFYVDDFLTSKTNNLLLIKSKNKNIIIRRKILNKNKINIDELKGSYIIASDDYILFKHYIILNEIIEVKSGKIIEQEKSYINDLILFMQNTKTEDNKNYNVNKNKDVLNLDKEQLLLFKEYFFEAINEFGFTKIAIFLNKKNYEIKNKYLENFGTLEKNKSFFYFNNKKIYGFNNLENEWMNHYKINENLIEKNDIFYDTICLFGFKKSAIYSNLDINFVKNKFYETFKIKNKSINRKNEILNSMTEKYDENIFNKENTNSILNSFNERKSVLEFELILLSNKYKISENNIRTFLIKNNFLIVEKKHEYIMKKILIKYHNSINISNSDIQIVSNINNWNIIKVKQILKKYKYMFFNANSIKLIENKSELNMSINKFLLEGYKMISSNYLISKEGEILKISNNLIKKVPWIQRINNTGFKCYSVSINAKSKYVHKIFAESFIENKENYKYVSAKDGNFMNINEDNLFWVKSPSNRRVIKNISNIFNYKNKENSNILEFIIKNFVNGMKYTNLIKHLTKIAIKDDMFKNTSNINLWGTIKHYSNLNKNNKFNIFIIREENANRVYLDNINVGKIIEMVKND